MAHIHRSELKTASVTPRSIQGDTSGKVLVAQGASTKPAWRALSGDATIDAAGVVTVSSGSVDPSDFATIGKAATNLAQDDLVYVSGVTAAGVPVFSLADADVLGGTATWVCTATLASGATSGTKIFRKSALSVATLNTNAATVGDPVYLTSTGTTGNTWSLSAPAVGIAVQVAGRVNVKSATVGQIAWDITSNADFLAAGSNEIAAQAVTMAKLQRGTNGQLIIGATGADPAYQSVTGDVTINSTGVTTIGGGKISLSMLQNQVLQQITVPITNAEFLNLRAAPKTLVAAPAAGSVHQLVSATLSSLASGGAYTETADNLAVRYTDGLGAIASGDIETTGVIDSTAQKYSFAGPAACLPVPAAALVLHNTGDGEFGGGNAANTMKLQVYYRTVVLP